MLPCSSNDFDHNEIGNESTRNPQDYLQSQSSYIVPEIRLLFQSPQIITVDVTHLRLEAAGAKHLSVLLCIMPNLLFLHLGDNCLGKLGMQLLKPALRHKTMLEELSLESNFLRYEGAGELADCLGSLTKLRVLDLSMNEIPPEGAKALAPALGKLRLLEVLQLSFNCIEDEGLIQICSALQGLNYLEDVGLCDNEIGSLSVPALIAAFSRKPNLKKVVIGYNPKFKNADKFKFKRVAPHAIHFGSYRPRCTLV